MQKLLNFIIAAILAVIIPQLTIAQNAPVAQWHFDGNHHTTSDGQDWVLGLVSTAKGEHIACGYSTTNGSGILPNITKVNNLGQVVWSRTLSGVSGITSISDGLLFSIVSEGNGKYIACGYFEEPGYAGKQGLVVEINDAGTITASTQVYNYSGATETTLTSIAYAGSDIFVTGGQKTSSQPFNGFVSKLGISSLSPSHEVDFASSIYNGNNLGNKVLAIPKAGGHYDVYVCGFLCVADDGTATANNSNGTPVTVTSFTRKAQFSYYYDDLSLQFSKNYNKSDITSVAGSIPSTASVGPGSARNAINILGTTYIAASAAAGTLQEANNNDVEGRDMVYTNDNKIALIAATNIISARPSDHPPTSQGNGIDIFQDIAGDIVLTDPIRTAVDYDDYYDADAFLLKIDPSNGDLISNTTAYASHFSGDDFELRLIENTNDEYVIAGSSADYYGSSPTEDLPEVAASDGHFLSIKDGEQNIIWERTYRAHGVEDAFCVFALAPTDDNGFIVGGNNGTASDNFSISKFAPNCARIPDAVANYSLGNTQIFNVGAYYRSNHTPSWNSHSAIPGNTFSDHANINSLIVIPSGYTLTIDHVDLRFTSSDQVYDYYMFMPTLPTGITKTGTKIGIEIQKGGRLIVTNSTLEGLNECGTHYMWDGINIIGNDHVKQSLTADGSLVVSSSSIIKDARIGINVADALRNYYQPPAVTSTVGSVTGSLFSSRYQDMGTSGGGLVNLDGATVTNCRFGIRFANYNPSNGSIIKRSTFDNDDYMADPCFYISSDGVRMGTNYFISAFNVDGVQILTNTFNADPTLFTLDKRASGIVAWDAGLIIGSDTYFPLCTGCPNPYPSLPAAGSVGNTFTNLNFGVQAGQATMSGRPLVLWFNNFDNNNQGAALSGANAITMAYNKFQVPLESTLVPQPYGSTITSCKGYDIGDNVFDKCSTCTGSPTMNLGIVVKNLHDNDEFVRRNNFNNISYNSIALQDNGIDNFLIQFPTGLQIKCNDYQSNSNIDIIRISFDQSNFTNVHATLKRDQGNCSSGASGPAGNRFYNSCTVANKLNSDFYVTQNVNYHINAAGTAYDPGTCIAGTYMVANCMTTIEHSFACPDRFSGGLAYGRLSSANTGLSNPTIDSDTRAALLIDQWEAVSDIARNYSLASYYDSAAMILVAYSRYTEALPYYLQDSNWTAARSTWTNLPTSTTAEQQYATLMDIAITLDSAGISWTDADSTSKAVIDSIANQNTFAGYLAQSLMITTGQIDTFNWPMPKMTDSSGNPLRPAASQPFAATASSLFSIYPNPTSGGLKVYVSKDGTLRITDVQGKTVALYTTKAGISEFNLPATMVNGVYFAAYRSNDGKEQRNVKINYQR